MNRALRRQQTKEPKGQDRPAARAVPRTGAPGPGARKEGRSHGFIKPPRFLADVFNELRKVVWPTREDVMHLTVVVVIITILTGMLLGAIDIGFGWIIDKTLLR